MKTCILDGNVILNKEMLHEMLAEQLDFPHWYGKNLDALYDLLTDLQETEIVIFHQEALFNHLERYASLLIRVLEDAAKENHGIRWRVAE
ncbi:MAG: barstar family protein [Lachnospiraceae bacterium]|nr:barstar family protein [Lachnospiraceae bacterium]